METKIYAAAVEGSVESLLNLLQEDALALDRFMASCYSETPLHIASMLGHVDFVQEILSRKPELTGKLDSRNSSPIHLATAKGYLDIVLKLASANPEMCLACDRDGKNPLHIAAIKGHVNILRELIQLRPLAARKLMERGESILHACVNYNQLETMKLLVEKMNDQEFVNTKDDNGNTILHLAVIDKQVEAIKYLTANTTIEVNAKNANRLTALDILTQSKRALQDFEIGELLRGAGGISVKSTHELGTAQTTSTSVLISSDEKQKEWLKEMRSTLMVVATLIAAAAYQAALYPPGGTWQDNSEENKGHYAGYSILAGDNPIFYSVFFVLNTIGFVASLSIILLLVSGLPFFKRRFFIWVLMVIMWIAISALAGAYLFTMVNLVPTVKTPVDNQDNAVLFVWGSLMGILLLAHAVRFIMWVIRKKRRVPTGSNGHQPADHTVLIGLWCCCWYNSPKKAKRNSPSLSSAFCLIFFIIFKSK